MALKQSLHSKQQGGTAVAEQPPSAAGGILAKYAPPTKPTGTGGGVSYVGFGASDKSPNALVQRKGGINEGDPFLNRASGAQEKLSPFRFVLIHASEFWERVDSSYGTLGVRMDEPPERGSKYKALVESLIIVLTPTGPQFATCGWRTAKAGAVRLAMGTVDEAGKPSWVGISPAHAATGQIADPRLRFVTNVSTRCRTVKGGDLAGTRYYEAKGAVEPITAADAKQISDYMNSAEGVAALQSADSVYQARLEHLTSYVGK